MVRRRGSSDGEVIQHMDAKSLIQGRPTPCGHQGHMSSHRGQSAGPHPTLPGPQLCDGAIRPITRFAPLANLLSSLWQKRGATASAAGRQREDKVRLTREHAVSVYGG